MISAMFRMNPIRWQAVLAFFWALLGVLTGLYGGRFRDVDIPNWAGWFMAAVGGVVFVICIRSISKGDDTKREKRGYTEKEVADGLKELERMYIKDHGRLPEYPEVKTENPQSQPDRKNTA